VFSHIPGQNIFDQIGNQQKSSQAIKAEKDACNGCDDHVWVAGNFIGNLFDKRVSSPMGF
jgi:hypothetical protein